MVKINEKLSIYDIRKINEQYAKEYKFLYENEDNVCGYEDALNFYEDNISDWLNDTSFKKYMFALCCLRQDAFASDREIVALMFACNDNNMFID